MIVGGIVLGLSTVMLVSLTGEFPRISVFLCALLESNKNTMPWIYFIGIFFGAYSMDDIIGKLDLFSSSMMIEIKDPILVIFSGLCYGGGQVLLQGGFLDHILCGISCRSFRSVYIVIAIISLSIILRSMNIYTIINELLPLYIQQISFDSLYNNESFNGRHSIIFIISMYLSHRIIKLTDTRSPLVRYATGMTSMFNFKELKDFSKISITLFSGLIMGIGITLSGIASKEKMFKMFDYPMKDLQDVQNGLLIMLFTACIISSLGIAYIYKKNILLLYPINTNDDNVKKEKKQKDIYVADMIKYDDLSLISLKDFIIKDTKIYIGIILISISLAMTGCEFIGTIVSLKYTNKDFSVIFLSSAVIGTALGSLYM
jgi:hypothetical protein